MTVNNERVRAVEPTGEVNETAESARRRLRTRVISEAVVAAIPEEGEAEPESGADDESGAGA